MNRKGSHVSSQRILGLVETPEESRIHSLPPMTAETKRSGAEAFLFPLTPKLAFFFQGTGKACTQLSLCGKAQAAAQ